MKTLFKTIICGICLMLWSISCSDFLEEDPKGQLATIFFFSDKNDLNASMNALYSIVSSSQAGNHQTGTRCLAGDDLSTHPASNKFPLRQHDQYKVTDSNPWIVYNWEELFRVVKAANFVINNADRCPAEQEDINYLKAQAYYWRGYALFQIVRIWGAVPVSLEEEINYDQELWPVEDIYNQVVSDLKMAEGCRRSYPAQPYTGKAVTECGAKATLGYVYLSMAGWPLNKGTEYYQLAANKLREVIDGCESGIYPHSLLDECWKIHSIQYNFENPEVLVGVYYSRAGNQTCGSPATDLSDALAVGAWEDTHAEIKFWKNFPEGPRKQATYIQKYVRTDGVAIDWWEMTSESPAPFFKKSAEASTIGAEWDELDPTPVPFSGEKTHQVVRLAEVYCWYAEAVGRSGQTNAKAVEVLNKVRNRADGAETNLYPASMSPTELAEAAYDEDGWEIAGYYWANIGARYFNEFRMYRVKDHFEYRKQNPMIEVAPGIFRNEVVPVPQEDIDNGVWDDSRMYSVPPPQDSSLNPNLR